MSRRGSHLGSVSMHIFHSDCIITLVNNVIRMECDFFEKNGCDWESLRLDFWLCDVTLSLVQLSGRRNTDKMCDIFRDFRDFWFVQSISYGCKEAFGCCDECLGSVSVIFPLKQYNLDGVRIFQKTVTVASPCVWILISVALDPVTS